MFIFEFIPKFQKIENNKITKKNKTKKTCYNLTVQNKRNLLFSNPQ